MEATNGASCGWGHRFGGCTDIQINPNKFQIRWNCPSPLNVLLSWVKQQLLSKHVEHLIFVHIRQPLMSSISYKVVHWFFIIKTFDVTRPSQGWQCKVSFINQCTWVFMTFLPLSQCCLSMNPWLMHCLKINYLSPIGNDPQWDTLPRCHGCVRTLQMSSPSIWWTCMLHTVPWCSPQLGWVFWILDPHHPLLGHGN